MNIKKALACLVLFALMITTTSGLCTLETSAVTETYQVSEEYKSSKYYEHLGRIELTGDQATDVIAIALSQLGYHEGDGDSDLDGMNSSGTKNFVEYNVLYGKLDNQEGNGLSYGYAWCASFVNWCLRQSRVEKTASGSEVSCRRWLADCKDMGIYVEKKNYAPKTADLIFFKDAGSSVTSTHIGMVLYSDENRVYTIEGNASSGSALSTAGHYVCLRSYKLSDKYIVGYASPKYKTDETALKVDHSGEEMSSGLYISKGEINVYSDEKMSENSDVLGAYELLTVKERYGDCFKISYQKDGKTYGGYAKAAKKAVQISSDGATEAIELIHDAENEYVTRFAVLPSTTIALPDPEITRETSGFVGWKVIETGELLQSGDTLSDIDKKTILVAQWDETLYTVTFADSDGKVLKEIKGYYGDLVEPPEVDDECFEGWGVDEIPAKITESIVYTAVYSEKPNAFGCRSSVAVSILPSLIALGLSVCFAIQKRKFK
ncbi:MAG: CHAP domain-containing protein [Ruminococcaceae bacterium]|nr:CHAP domain-containing protein [Oscillospiraceae bacterium]